MIIWLASYPRSGNSLFANLANHHLGISLYSIYKEDSPYIYLNPTELKVATESKDLFLVKTHELPSDDTPAVYIVRDGRDAIISYAHYIINNNLNLPVPAPENPFAWALDVLINTSDQFNGWGNHIQAWTSRASAKTVIVRYEDISQKANQFSALTSSLGELKVEPLEVVNNNPLPDFSKYKKEKPNFYRKGKIGSWITEMPLEYHLQFWEKYGESMQKLGYKNEGENAIRTELVLSEFSQKIEKKIEQIVSDNESNQKIIYELLNTNEAKERVNQELQQVNQELQQVNQELQQVNQSQQQEMQVKENVIQSFRKSLFFNLIHGPLRHIPFVAKILRMLARVKSWFVPHLGVLYQHSPMSPNLPARYFRVDKLNINAPIISIVTPSYNQGGFIERTIKSVLYQDYPKLEYIVQDGGSNDGTSEVVKKFQRRLKHFESKKDNGQAHAINLGFGHATGDIMAYLNSDDVLLPNTLFYIANYFATHPEVDVVYGHRLIIDENDQVVGDWIMPKHDSETLKWADYIPQETMFWRRSIWDKVGGQMDESFQFALDWDLLLRFQEAGAKFEGLPRYLSAFRVHRKQKSTEQIADVGEKDSARLRLRSLGREVNYQEIRKHIRLFLIRSIWHTNLHKLKIQKDKFLAKWNKENEPVEWYVPESKYFISIHKSGTSLFTHVLRQANELRHVDYQTMIFDNKVDIVVEFYKYGDVYGIIRIMEDKEAESYIYILKFILDENFIIDKKCVFLVRDPRDIVVSWYYSMGVSHILSENLKVSESIIKVRKKLQTLTIDEAVIKGAKKFKSRFEILYKLSQSSKTSVMLKYEDLINNFDYFVKEFSKYISIPEERIEELYVASRPRDDEDISAHKRSGKIGQYKEKLKPETIEELNKILKPVLDKFGYPIE